MIGIVDYGMGNLRSVEKGFEKVGVAAEVCPEAGRLSSYDGLVLPGVGAFGEAMEHLDGRAMTSVLRDYIGDGRPLLGICLGMQLLFSYSEEHGRNEGLGLVPGAVLRLPDTVKVPHMGWNVVNFSRETQLFNGIESGSRFYFVHSFYCAPDGGDWIAGTTPYGLDFASAICRDGVWGLQFHPEKSSALGLGILKNFGRMVESRR